MGCEFFLQRGQACPGEVAFDTRCAEHNQLYWRVCAGCGRDATRQCDHCVHAVCQACFHQTDGSHGTVPATPQRPPGQQAGPGALKRDLTEATMRILTDCAERGWCAFAVDGDAARTATAVVDRLGTHALLQVLTAMAQAVP